MDRNGQDDNRDALSMSRDEAQQCVARIAHHLEEARALLLELYEREGWRALGYDSWRACVVAEFSQSQTALYRQLTAARVERTISHNGKNGDPIPVLHALELAPLEPPEQRAIAAANDVSKLTLGQLRAVIRDRQAEQRASRLENRPVAIPLPMQRHDVDDDTCRIVVGDAARISLPDGNEHSAACQPASCPHVALAVTSPPYCLGIQEQGYVDFTVYADYLTAAASWAAELYRVLQPNGRLTLNVPVDIARGQREALACDWLQLLRAAGFRYRTTIVWAEGNIARSTARGSIDSPSAINLICPAEVVLIVHKGEWNLGRTDPSDLGHDEWLAWTLAAWSFPGEHADRVGYPAAFPEELPRRLIKLLSFPGDLVVDPFVGSGTTAVMACALSRRVWGCDRYPSAVARSQARVATAEIQP
jgi:site-specific DNA-methyltransferase (adenine-specific)